MLTSPVQTFGHSKHRLSSPASISGDVGSPVMRFDGRSPSPAACRCPPGSYIWGGALQEAHAEFSNLEGKRRQMRQVPSGHNVLWRFWAVAATDSECFWEGLPATGSSLCRRSDYWCVNPLDKALRPENFSCCRGRECRKHKAAWLPWNFGRPPSERA